MEKSLQTCTSLRGHRERGNQGGKGRLRIRHRFFQSTERDKIGRRMLHLMTDGKKRLQLCLGVSEYDV